MNVFQFILQSALRHHDRRRTELGDNYDFSAVLREDAIHARWERAWEYVQKLADAGDEFRAAEKRDRGGMDGVEWAKQRQVSKEHQLERYKV